MDDVIVNCLNSPAFRTLVIILGLIVGLLLCNLHVTYKYQKRIKKQPENTDYLEKELEKEKKQVIVYWLAIVFILFAPIAINFFFSLNIQYPTAPHLGNTEWLGFWGSYTGGVIGAIVTGVAFFFTYMQNQKQHEDTRKQMLYQQRLQVLPFLTITRVDYRLLKVSSDEQAFDLSVGSTQTEVFQMHIKNVSSSPALFFELEGAEGHKAEHILPNQMGIFLVVLPANEGQKAFDLRFTFNDSLGNKYRQSFTLLIETKSIKRPKFPLFSQPSFPQLISNPSYKTDPSTRQPSEVNQ